METNLHRAGVPSSFTQLDIILPSQHFGSQRKQAPEQRLMMAVPQDALDYLEKYRFATGSHGRRLFHEAKQWCLAEETTGRTPSNAFVGSPISTRMPYASIFSPNRPVSSFQLPWM